MAKEEQKVLEILEEGEGRTGNTKVGPGHMRVSRASRVTNVSYNAGQILRPGASPGATGL
jgi:hypothetical protein